MSNESAFLNLKNSSKLTFGKINVALEKQKDVYKIIKFFLYRYFHSSLIIYIYIFSVVLSLFLLFIPMFYCFTMLFSISIIFSSLMTYGFTFYIINRSTIYKNMKNTTLSRPKIYFSIFVLTIITNIILVFFIVAIIASMGALGLLRNSYFPPLPPSVKIKGESSFIQVTSGLGQIRWDIFAYFFILLSTSTFVMALFFQSVSKNTKSFVLFSIFYSVITVIIGNCISFAYVPALNGSFDSTSFDTFVVNPNSVVNLDTTNEVITISAERLGHIDEQSFNKVSPPTGFFGTTFSLIWWLALFFPSNFVNLFSTPMFFHSTIRAFDPSATPGTIGGINVIYNGISINGYSIRYSFFSASNPEWLFIIIWPYFLMVFYFSLGFWYSKEK